MGFKNMYYNCIICMLIEIGEKNPSHRGKIDAEKPEKNPKLNIEQHQ